MAENEKKKNVLKWVCIAGGAAILAAAYIIFSQRFRLVFEYNTYINGINVSGMTASEVHEMIRNAASGYSINVKCPRREDEVISGEDVELHYRTGNDIDLILNDQNVFLWPGNLVSKKEYTVASDISIDMDLLREKCAGLKAFDDSTGIRSENAFVGEYDSSLKGYAVIPEKDGNIIEDKDGAVKFIYDSMAVLGETADLGEREDLFEKAEIRSDSESIIEEKQKLDGLTASEIRYISKNITVNGEKLASWVNRYKFADPEIDTAKVRDFIDNELAPAYDTLGKDRKFTTAWGDELTVFGGNFGWEVDREAEFNALTENISRKESAERDPVFSSEGVEHSDTDWGNTYIEVNVAKQHMYLFVDGEIKLHSDVVTGTENRSRATPNGVYKVTYKGRNATLRGPRRADGSYEYQSFVNYWMPFNKGIGLHDATWRGSFGGNTYKYSGSHGCVNMPKSNAAKLYEYVYTGMPVIVYGSRMEADRTWLDKVPEQHNANLLKKWPEVPFRGDAEKYIPETTAAPETTKAAAPAKKTAPAETAPSQPQVPETLPESIEVYEPETSPEEYGPAFQTAGGTPEGGPGAEVPPVP